MENSLTIGVPIRNEEESLPTFTKSLKQSIDILNIEYPSLLVETIFCINGTTDKSADILSLILSGGSLNNTQVIYSEQGKINAILEITKKRKSSQGPICFIDADVELDQYCILNLYNDLVFNTDIFLAYSSVIPKSNKTFSFIQKIQHAHYSLRYNVSPRKYFHGRAYIMRSDVLLKEIPKKMNAGCWNLNEGPYVDDIYLSRLVVHTFGLSSIKENRISKLYFLPPQSLKDFYLGQRRLMFEIKRLNMLYPEHIYIQKIHFKKRVNWSYFLKIKPHHFISYLPYYTLEEIVKAVVRFEMYMITLHIIKCKKIWKPLKSTKKWKRY